MATTEFPRDSGGRPSSSSGPGTAIPKQIAIWAAVAVVGAIAWGILALSRGEEISAAWLVFAALASYAIGYRFYARFIVRKALRVDDTRATPAERLNDGQDYQPTDRRVLFGHHFAAIAGAGPLVGPVLAAQMGYLPGTLWIIIGVIFAGAVQDMVTLFFSTRRGGRSLGQMAREEIGPVGGAAALIAVLAIMIILLAVLALVVVQALAQLAVGHLLAGHDHPDRPVHGLLPALPAARGRSSRSPRSASRCCCWPSSPAAGCRSRPGARRSP